MAPIVLITGCSTGIGRDLAQGLSQAGCTVVATARKPETLDDLSAALKLSLDVTRQDSVDAAVARTIQQFGRIDVLVNNAGYALRGAVEEIPVAQVQTMFDANVFGVIRMIQAVVPQMRKQGAGRIINISSIVGKLVTPANGTYSSTKFAVEGLSNALRMELAPFGIQVSLVEPGSIKTQFHATVESSAKERFANPDSPYHPLYQKYEQVTASMRKQESGPEVVSKVIQEVIETPHPKARYTAGFPLSGRLVMFLGDWAWDLVVQQMFRIK